MQLQSLNQVELSLDKPMYCCKRTVVAASVRRRRSEKRKVAVRKLCLRVRVERATVRADPSANADGASAALECATKLQLHLY